MEKVFSEKQLVLGINDICNEIFIFQKPLDLQSRFNLCQLTGMK